MQATELSHHFRFRVTFAALAPIPNFRPKSSQAQGMAKYVSSAVEKRLQDA